MDNDLNQATMKYRVTSEGGKVAVELYNGYGSVRIPAETLHKINSSVLAKERELGNEKRWYGQSI